MNDHFDERDGGDFDGLEVMGTKRGDIREWRDDQVKVRSLLFGPGLGLYQFHLFISVITEDLVIGIDGLRTGDIQHIDGRTKDDRETNLDVVVELESLLCDLHCV